MTHNKGFTLIETIFSTLFIGLTVLAIMNLFPGAYLSIGASERTLQADIIAKSLMDQLRSRLDFMELEETALASSQGFNSRDHRSSNFFSIFDIDEPNDERKSLLDPVRIDGIQYEIGRANSSPGISIFSVPGMDPLNIVRVKVVVSYRVSLLSEPKEMVHETYLHSMGVRSQGFYTMSEGRP